MNTIGATVIADSISTRGHRLTTVLARYPKWLQAEINTHRMISKSAASSRAIPISKVISRVDDDPWVPTQWFRNTKGMQARAPLERDKVKAAIMEWHDAADLARQSAETLMELGVYKGHVNRVLEPFMWTEGLLTATDWENFTALRANEAAQPEFQELAFAIIDALNDSDPVTLRPGQWHLPFGDKDLPEGKVEILRMVVVTRCARQSYMNFNGTHDIAEDIRLFNQLMTEGHWGPFEHPAVAVDSDEYIGNFQGWMQFRKFFRGENRTDSRLIKKEPRNEVQV